MPKYRVYGVQTFTYVAIVKAKDFEEAFKKAEIYDQEESNFWEEEKNGSNFEICDAELVEE